MLPLHSILTRVSSLNLDAMQIYLGLGSNEGDRKRNLHDAIDRLRQRGLLVTAVSPIVETPALLPQDAPADWNTPFLNLVIRGEIPRRGAEPENWRSVIKGIEDEYGRIRGSRWAPRPIDIDILLWGEEKISTETLTIPHPDTLDRSFVLTPLVHIDPNLRIPGCEDRTTFGWSLDRQPIPLWMGIINLTPDSFSHDDDCLEIDALLTRVDEMVEQSVQIVDLGAESTRPGAETLGWEDEWARLRGPLQAVIAHLTTKPLAPRISIDTRNWQVAARALSMGVNFINDISGLTEPNMCAVARESDADWVVMHHLSAPASRKERMSTCTPPTETVIAWLQKQLDQLEGKGIDSGRLIVDPGIGFGKDPLQNLKLLREIPLIRKEIGLRVLVGHSRKTFMNYSPPVPPRERDLETIGSSLKLCELGVDILRVHNVTAHARAYRAWSHVQGFPVTKQEPGGSSPRVETDETGF